MREREVRCVVQRLAQVRDGIGEVLALERGDAELELAIGDERGRCATAGRDLAPERGLEQRRRGVADGVGHPLDGDVAHDLALARAGDRLDLDRDVDRPRAGELALDHDIGAELSGRREPRRARRAFTGDVEQLVVADDRRVGDVVELEAEEVRQARRGEVEQRAPRAIHERHERDRQVLARRDRGGLVAAPQRDRGTRAGEHHHRERGRPPAARGPERARRGRCRRHLGGIERRRERRAIRVARRRTLSDRTRDHRREHAIAGRREQRRDRVVLVVVAGARTGRGLEQRHAKRVDVRARVDVLAEHLLGRHVRRRPHAGAGHRQLAIAGNTRRRNPRA